MLGDVNKLFVFITLLTTLSNILPLHMWHWANFPAHNLNFHWRWSEGDVIKSRLPFKIFSPLLEISLILLKYPNFEGVFYDIMSKTNTKLKFLFINTKMRKMSILHLKRYIFWEQNRLFKHTKLSSCQSIKYLYSTWDSE